MRPHRTTLFALSILALAACSRPQQREPAAEPAGLMHRSDPVFLQEDPASRKACKADADCGTGELCHPGHGRCFSSYPNPRMLEVSLKLDECRLTNIYFPFDSTELVEEARRWLEYDARCLKARTASVIQLEGHADKQGPAGYNLDLSRRRAEVVKAELERLGIAPRAIQLVARGEKDPLTTGNSEQDYAWNRRVELRAR